MSIRPHAFVAMPFGVKSTADGQSIDFDRVYAEYIAPAVVAAGLDPFRADEEQRAGEIRADMFQELLIADLVVVDLTIDNPNVWYELGVRHALRSRGVVLVTGGRTKAFDVYTDRKVHYSIANGGPDAAKLPVEIERLTEMIRATMESWHGRKVSPVYQLLPNLREPDWKSLRLGDAREFWELHDEWVGRLDLARREDRIGDLLVLADEAPVAAFRAEAWVTAGEALRKAGRFAFALEQLEKALDIEPANLRALREKGICLQRLALAGRQGHTLEKAREHYRVVLEDHPNDTETWSLLGRVDKDAWTAAWRRSDLTLQGMRAAASDEEALLRSAIDSYMRAYRIQLSHYYSGINALTLMVLANHLTRDPQYEEAIAKLEGAVRFAAECETDEAQLYWAKATLGDLAMLGDETSRVVAAYKAAIARSEKDWFALTSTRAQLELLATLGFRPRVVKAALALFDRAIERLKPPEGRWQPRQVVLFSGHMVDAPDREEPRFPLGKVPIAAERIGAALDALGVGPEDLAFSQAASGGDLLFIEACQKRGARSQVLLPFPEPRFIENSVVQSAGADEWRRRFYAMKDALTLPIRVMPDELGEAPKHVNPYERCNLWLLYSTLACGLDKVRYITLWNGGGGDGRGGAAHMYEAVQERTGRVTWIDTRTL
jgi:tetratricopeptide (TPR) repeat protein